MELKPCPWCGNTPIFVEDNFGCEIWCINTLCRAKPKISTFRGYTKEQVSVVWNSYFEKQKKEAKNLRKFNDYVSKNILQNALIDAMCCEEIWYKYLPDIPYMKIE